MVQVGAVGNASTLLAVEDPPVIMSPATEKVYDLQLTMAYFH